jgi:nucleotide-binding universal stress UspA family protein
MFERIVAAIDSDPERSARVVEAAKELAQKFGSEVVIAHVRDVERPTAMVAPTARPGALPPVVHLESEEEARALVDAAVARLRHVGVRADGQIAPGTTGSTARELLAIAQSHGATLIVVGDRGSRVTDVLLGSVAYRVVHRAECPVLLVR